eukprot:GHRR01001837.1.p1 GENE.GHRR01001837.1~~GHRR01001837.1.p1  ORF type:complete len:348 (+),score=117.88 GHRR01001837.1:182-1225(+)
MADLNPFDLLGDSDENISPEQLAAAKVAAVKPAPKKEEPKVAAKTHVAREDAGRGRGHGEGRSRGGGRGRFGGPRPDSGEVAENGFDEGGPAARGGRGGGRGEFRGRFAGPGRGRGGARGYDSNRPRREFDRHDGTGRGYEAQKRGGGGRGNWGPEDGSADAPNAEEAATVEEPEKVVAQAEEAAAAEGDAAAGENEEQIPPVEEIKELTLDEYEAMLAEKKAELNKARQARTIDTSEFANLKPLKKDEQEDENPLEVSNSKEKRGPRAKERKEIVTVETNFQVGAPEPRSNRGRGERGGRGRGGRGSFGRSNGGDRPERPYGGRGGRGERGAHINVEDTSAFPSLG